MADQVLRSVSFEVQNDLDATKHEPHRKEEEEEHQRPAGKSRHRVEQRQERNQGQDGAAIADTLEDRSGKAERHQCPGSSANQAETKQTLLDVHHPLQVGQPWWQTAHTERINEKAGIYPLLWRQFKTDLHRKTSR